jgi:hypothetical protein
VINASLRSGTNGFHGSAYDFVRNTSLNAVGFFKPTRGIKPVLIQNQFGFTVGGPLSRTGPFSFLITKAFAVSRVRCNCDRADGGAAPGQLGVPVRNPFTGEVFADGNIPANQITPFARQVLAALVLPTTSPNATGVVSNNFEDLPRSKFYNDKGDLKIDQNFSSKTTAFVRLSKRKIEQF